MLPVLIPRGRSHVVERKATTVRGLAVMDGHFTTEIGQPYPELPDVDVDASQRSFCYGSDGPVLYEHDWR
jgi:hypothetical protein